MRRVFVFAAVIAGVILLSAFLHYSPINQLSDYTNMGDAFADQSPGEVVGDNAAQSNIRRGGEDIPEITSVTMASYLHLTHKERDTCRQDDIGFWTPDTLDGRVHSNDTIHIEPFSDRPRFMKRVTTSMNYIFPPNNHARFDEGWGYGPPIIFPDSATTIRENAGLWLGTQGPDSLIQIVLDSTLILWRRCGVAEINGEDSIRCYPTRIANANTETIPASGAIFVEGKLWVSASRNRRDIMDGEFPERRFNEPAAYLSRGFEGQLTIGCSDTIIISDNLIYKHALPNYRVPTTMDSCADILGLVSEKFIMMHRQVRDTLYIHAAMAAVVGSISVQDIYWYTPPGRLNPKQSLFIWGSLAQRNGGIIHTTYPCGNDCERGFDEKEYHYDVRLRGNPPPHFPLAVSRFGRVEDDTLRY